MNLNKVFILGRVTADPQVRSTPTGQQVANFSIATNRVWNDRSGSRQEETEYHNVVVWGRQAEIASQFLSKGSLILVEGRLKTRSWENQQGQKQKTTEIICERLQLGPRSASAGFAKDKQPIDQTGISPKEEALPEINIDDEEIKPEDLPF